MKGEMYELGYRDGASHQRRIAGGWTMEQAGEYEAGWDKGHADLLAVVDRCDDVALVMAE